MGPNASAVVADPHRPEPTIQPTTVRPYGVIGLTVSFVLILAATLGLLALVAALTFCLTSLVFGWHSASQRVVTLATTAGSDAVVLQRAGVLLSLAVYTALGAAVLAAARLRGGMQWRQLIGWHQWHPLRGARLFWWVAAIAIVYGFVADVVVSKLYPPSQDWVTLPQGAIWAVLFIVLAVFFAPVAEELLFRGWIYTGLRVKIGIWGGILVTALLFALAHWEKTHIYALMVFPVGVMLGFVREKTASLKASIALHALFNSAASAALLLGQ